MARYEWGAKMVEDWVAPEWIYDACTVLACCIVAFAGGGAVDMCAVFVVIRAIRYTLLWAPRLGALYFPAHAPLGTAEPATPPAVHTMATASDEDVDITARIDGPPRGPATLGTLAALPVDHTRGLRVPRLVRPAERGARKGGSARRGVDVEAMLRLVCAEDGGSEAV